MTQELSKSLTVWRGTSILLNIVIGAGLLTLPGLAIEQVGGFALVAWLACAVLALPLLVVFIVLGRQFPEAGGVAAYGRRAFGSFGERTASYLFLGAVALGLPGIALTGGHYLSTVLGGSPHLYAIVLILGAVTPNLVKGGGAAKIMSWLASLILAVVVAFLAVGLIGVIGKPIRTPPRLPGLADAISVAPTLMMIFFAFTGWEVGAGIAEEFRDPRRDYPLAMLASFGIAVTLYFAIAFVAQASDITGSFASPFIPIVAPILGTAGTAAIAITASIIVFANLAGAVWGVSRLLYSLSRSGMFPPVFGKLVGDKPLVSVLTVVAVLSVVVLLDGSRIIGLTGLFGLAGENFLTLYAIAAIVILKIGKGRLVGAISVFVLVESLLLLAAQGISALYPALIVVLSVIVEYLQQGIQRRRAFGQSR